MGIEIKNGAQEAVAKARAHSARIFQSGLPPEHKLPFPGTREDSGWKYDPESNNFIEVDVKGCPIQDTQTTIEFDGIKTEMVSIAA